MQFVPVRMSDLREAEDRCGRRDIGEEDSFLRVVLFRQDVMGSLMFRNGLG